MDVDTEQPDKNLKNNLENYDSDEEVLASDVSISLNKNIGSSSMEMVLASDTEDSPATDDVVLNPDPKKSTTESYENLEKDIFIDDSEEGNAIENDSSYNSAMEIIADVELSNDIKLQKETSNCDDLSDQSVSDDSSNSELSCMLTFPDGSSFDLSDNRNHVEILKRTTALVTQLKSLSEKNNTHEIEMKEKDLLLQDIRGKHEKEIANNKILEEKNQNLYQELEKAKEMLKSNQIAARTAIDRLHKENSEQIKTLKAQCLSMQKEKEASVMNFARREKELLDFKRTAENADKKAREALKDKEKMVAQMRGLKMDLAKMKSALEKKEAETNQVRKELEKVKNDTGSQSIKVKWAQNKLKSESDAHSETKEKLAKAMIEIKQAKEETEQIRINCQGMIKTYQESEEMRSNSLDSQLKEKEILLSQQEARSGELEGIHKQQGEELRRLKQKHKDALEENLVMKTRVECLEKERVKNEETLKSYSEVLNNQKREASGMSERLKALEEVKGQLEQEKQEVERLEGQLFADKETMEHMKKSEESWKMKEQELLEFTQRVSTKNAELTSECEDVTSKFGNLSSDVEKYKNLLSSLQIELDSLKKQLEDQKRNENKVNTEMTRRLQDKETSVNQLTLQLDEATDENRTLKRKNNAKIKDLTRQLQQARKRLEPYESGSGFTPSGVTDNGSMGSRASSDTSLDCAGKSNANNSSTHSHNSAAETVSLSSNSMNGNLEIPDTMVTTAGEINKQALIEKIVRLQRIHARKNEKIDFLQDHVQQLIDEMQRKNKIIKHYILREESGMLMDEDAVSHYVASDHTSKMPRHISDEINRKMQSVLEDTLMKNIAMKESIDALGREIARLSTTARS